MGEEIKNIINEIKVITEKIDNFNWEVDRPDVMYMINLIRRSTYLSKKLEELRNG